MNKHLYISKGEENFPGENIKFLMQDGYYFTMSNIYPLPSTVGCSPGVAVKEIYSPSGELLYSGYFSVSSYITIYQNLIGVKDNGYLSNAYYDATREAGTYTLPKNLINEGLYVLKDAQLQSLYSYSESDPIRWDTAVLNQRLRPMINYQTFLEGRNKYALLDNDE